MKDEASSPRRDKWSSSLIRQDITDHTNISLRSANTQQKGDTKGDTTTIHLVDKLIPWVTKSILWTTHVESKGEGGWSRIQMNLEEEVGWRFQKGYEGWIQGSRKGLMAIGNGFRYIAPPSKSWTSSFNMWCRKAQRAEAKKKVGTVVCWGKVWYEGGQDDRSANSQGPVPDLQERMESILVLMISGSE